MRHRVRDFASHLMAAGVLEVLKLIAGLLFAAGTSVLAAQVLRTIVPTIAPFGWTLAIVFGTGGAWLFLVIYERLHRYRPKFPTIKSDFRVLEKNVFMKYIDKMHMEYTKAHQLRALRSGLDRYLDKYLWTGDPEPPIRSKVRGHTLLTTSRRNFWQHYEVIFGRYLNKDEEVRTELAWTLTDESRKAVPFISATVEEPTDLLRLALEVPLDWGLAEVVCEISSGASANRPLSTHSLPFDSQGKVEWLVETPRLLYHYEMRWSVPE